jgi:hypothetical protein
LQDDKVLVCSDGILPNVRKKLRMPPYPHFLAYDNLVASCDGKTLSQTGEIIAHHCCNNARGNRYVEPLYLLSDVSSKVKYDNRGHLVCDEMYIPSLGPDGLNLTCYFLNKVRLFWLKVVQSNEYDKTSIMDAIHDLVLRQNIVDDLFCDDSGGEWLFLNEQAAWAVFADYDWFYDYYDKE